MNRNSKIYISGHTGMVGTTLLQMLEKAGYANLITRTHAELDLRDQGAVNVFFDKEHPEFVIHLAARLGGIVANIERPAEFLYDNTLMACNVIEASHRNGVTKLINIASSCAYPRECPQPMSEKSLLSGKMEPTNEGYGIAKIVGLKLCETYNSQYKTNYLSLMSCNLYGVNDHFDPAHSHVIAALIMKFHAAKMNNQNEITLWGTGDVHREFLYVKDLAQAIVHFLSNYAASELNNQFVNIGSGSDISIKELAQLISGIVGYQGEILWDTSKPSGIPKKLLDISRAEKLGFHPETNLENGLKKTYDYYLQTIAASPA